MSSASPRPQSARQLDGSRRQPGGAVLPLAVHRSHARQDGVRHMEPADGPDGVPGRLRPGRPRQHRALRHPVPWARRPREARPDGPDGSGLLQRRGAADHPGERRRRHRVPHVLPVVTGGVPCPSRGAPAHPGRQHLALRRRRHFRERPDGPRPVRSDADCGPHCPCRPHRRHGGGPAPGVRHRGAGPGDGGLRRAGGSGELHPGAADLSAPPRLAPDARPGAAARTVRLRHCGLHLERGRQDHRPDGPDHCRRSSAWGP